MVATDFFAQLQKLQVTTYVGVEDFTDKLNFLYSVMLLLVFFTIVTVKTYVMSPLHCFNPHQLPPTFINFAENYCWAEGTYAVAPDKFDAMTPEAYASNKISYYQWVPFMLGLQAILFYLPRILWSVFSYNRTGTDLQHLISTANDAVHADKDKREKTIRHIVSTLEQMLFQHRDQRRGKMAELRRGVYTFCAMIFPSKRLGTWLFFCYIILKCLYLTNSIGQLYLLNSFLGFNRRNISHYGIEVLSNLLNNRDWQDTLVFPRVSVCTVRAKLSGTYNHYFTQCVLPVNMLNEKIYVFFWFWLVFVTMMNAMSIPLWIIRMSFTRQRTKLIIKFLKISENYTASNKKSVGDFCTKFLRHDGIFLIRMIALNAGDIIACDIVCGLWNRYNEKYLLRDMRNDISLEVTDESHFEKILSDKFPLQAKISTKLNREKTATRGFGNADFV